MTGSCELPKCFVDFGERCIYGDTKNLCCLFTAQGHLFNYGQLGGVMTDVERNRHSLQPPWFCTCPVTVVIEDSICR